MVDDKLQSALIGAGVASIGWFVTFFQQQYAKSREERRAFLKKQVEEFYEPLLAHTNGQFCLLYRKRPEFLSITHKLDSDHDSEFYVGESRQASPDDGIAWWWIMGSSEIAAQTSEFNDVVCKRCC